eukprot:scaffold131158_cov18-Prasinocladus_malaysianus.AAC.2
MELSRLVDHTVKIRVALAWAIIKVRVLVVAAVMKNFRGSGRPAGIGPKDRGLARKLYARTCT